MHKKLYRQALIALHENRHEDALKKFKKLIDMNITYQGHVNYNYAQTLYIINKKKLTIESKKHYEIFIKTYLYDNKINDLAKAIDNLIYFIDKTVLSKIDLTEFLYNNN